MSMDTSKIGAVVAGLTAVSAIALVFMSSSKTQNEPVTGLQMDAIAPVTQPAIAPVTQPATAPVTQPATAPVTQPAIAPVTQPAIAPVTQPAIAPVTQPAIAPVNQPAIAPVEPRVESPRPNDAPKGPSVLGTPPPVVSSTPLPESDPVKEDNIVNASDVPINVSSLAEPSAPPLNDYHKNLSPKGREMPDYWPSDDGAGFDYFIDNPSSRPSLEEMSEPPNPESRQLKWEGGTTRCAHCHRRLKRTKRNKKNIKV
jgi:hypothetical protein